MTFDRNLGVLLAALMLVGLGSETTRVMAATSAGLSNKSCVEISKHDFLHLPEAPAVIDTSTLVDAKGDVPAHCEVMGTIDSSIGFKLKLPVEDWNGKFFQAGCGNWCGTFYPRACDDPLSRGYACIATDSGHSVLTGDVNMTDASWAEDDLQAELDWGVRATHVTAVTGKAITQKFYSEDPSRSYFMGCSYGGHQALVLVQRFPWDFDGVVGGGAPNRISDLMQQNLWAIANGFDENLNSVFTEADITVLHNDVLSRCDMDDNVKDGLIANPAACSVNPDKLVCESGQSSGCISQSTADAAKKLYSGPVDSSGKALNNSGGWMPGSEVDWRIIYNSDGTGLVALAKNYFRYMGRNPDLGSDWQGSSYDFDLDYKRNDVMETLYAADNPDLRRFKLAGGKFINYVGWNDLGTLPGQAINYYETVVRTMGGYEKTEDFYRMFMLPGVRHCRGGLGADKVDFLTYLERWVEDGVEPDEMRATRFNANGATEFTRPIYPFPQKVWYEGKGDPDDASSYIGVSPK